MSGFIIWRLVPPRNGIVKKCDISEEHPVKSLRYGSLALNTPTCFLVPIFLC
jgi:hypothetical protein